MVDWWAAQQVTSIYLSVIVLHEIRYGVELLPAGKKKRKLETWLERVSHEFAGRILPVDEKVADLSGRLIAASKMTGHTAGVGDALIAATAQVHGLRMVTLNRKHFEWLGVELVEF